MTRTTKIVVISGSVLLAAGVLLFVFGQDAKRKQAYKTPVPPEYAQRLIKEITGK